MYSRLTHASNNQHSIFYPKHILIHLSKQKRAKHIEETLTIHLTYDKPYLKQNMATIMSSKKTYQTQNIYILETPIIHLRKPNTNA